MSVSLAHTLLEAYNPTGELGSTGFWKEPEFIGFNIVPPWYDGYVAEGHPVLSLDGDASSRAGSFAQHFWSLPSIQEKESVIKHPGDNHDGLDYCRKYITACIKAWNLNDILDKFANLKEVYRVSGPEVSTRIPHTAWCLADRRNHIATHTRRFLYSQQCR